MSEYMAMVLKSRQTSKKNTCLKTGEFSSRKESHLLTLPSNFNTIVLKPGLAG